MNFKRFVRGKCCFFFCLYKILASQVKRAVALLSLILCFAMLHYFIPDYTVLCSTIFCYTILY